MRLVIGMVESVAEAVGKVVVEAVGKVVVEAMGKEVFEVGMVAVAVYKA